MKRNAYDVIASLIENMHEGFHGTSYEMMDALRECDATTFARRRAIVMHDDIVVANARRDATCDDVFDNDDFANMIDEYIASNMYRNVVAQMINVTCDHTSRVVDNSSQSLHIRCVDMSRAIVETIIDDMHLSIACIDEIDTTTTFTREFYMSRVVDDNAY